MKQLPAGYYSLSISMLSQQSAIKAYGFPWTNALTIKPDNSVTNSYTITMLLKSNSSTLSQEHNISIKLNQDKTYEATDRFKGAGVNNSGVGSVDQTYYYTGKYDYSGVFGDFTNIWDTDKINTQPTLDTLKDKNFFMEFDSNKQGISYAWNIGKDGYIKGDRNCLEVWGGLGNITPYNSYSATCSCSYAGTDTQGESKTFSNSLGMTFNLIPAGTFKMGSPSNAPERNNDEIQHQVTLSKSYYMQTTEVTQGQWKAVMGSNPSYFQNCGNNCPVDTVSWNDIQIFITKLNAMGQGIYTLPTEAQWEYAARAGSTTAFANGGITEINCGYDANLDKMGWYCYNSGDKTHPVAQKTPNSWGLYDMHGNVLEWCQDLRGAYSSGSITDPVGPETGSHRVIRGGSWNNGGAGSCRSAYRFWGSPSDGYNSFGFRLVCLAGQQ